MIYDESETRKISEFILKRSIAYILFRVYIRRILILSETKTMQFRITLYNVNPTYSTIPVNYQYPLSSALYRIIAKGDVEYAKHLHEKGYGKGFKLFTFSQISCPFKIEGDRMHLQGRELSFVVSFHLPQTMENFVKGLFQMERIDIADRKSCVSFAVKTIESLPNGFLQSPDQEIVNVNLRPLSPISAGLKNDRGIYEFLSPDDASFKESLIFNWRNKIETCYGEAEARSALLLMEIVPMHYPFKSRMITIKEGRAEQTKIRGWLNFTLKVTAEKRFVELLVNSGAGIYNAMGCGCLMMMAE